MQKCEQDPKSIMGNTKMCLGIKKNWKKIEPRAYKEKKKQIIFLSYLQ
jgi:hypothetical protein